MLNDRVCLAQGAVDGGVLCGFALSRLAGEEAEILTFAVERARRRKGVGGHILVAHLSALGRAGIRTLFLEVEEANLAALALYRRFRFVEVGRRKAYYAKVEGARANAIVMRRDAE